MNQTVNTRNNVMVFIDGGYIRKYTKQKYNTDLINYDTLGRMLAQTVAGSGANLIRIYYYDAIASVKDADKIQDQSEKQTVLDEINRRIREQETYFERIHTQEFVTIRQGHLVVANKETPRQKGVDVLMAIDMLTAAYDRQYDWACLVAGDSDFLELVKAIKLTGVNIMGFYFGGHVSKELITALDRRHDLNGYAFDGNHII